MGDREAEGERKAQKDGDAREIQIWGLTLPLPPWAIACIAILVVVGVALTIFFKVVYPHLQAGMSPAVLDQLREAQKHSGESPSKQETVYADPKTSLVIDFFASDGCLLVIRSWTDTTKQPVKLFLRDLSDIRLPSSPGPVDGGRLSTEEPRSYDPTAPTSEPILATSVLAALLSRPRLETQPLDQTIGLSATSSAMSGRLAGFPQGGCGGRCWNPHQGPFNSWNGQINGDWVQVWRHWADNCTHYQWYNRRFGYYDPQVYWTCCVH